MESRLVTQASVAQQLRKNQNRRQKTFTGCWDCRARKVKCDEAKPDCTPCSSRGFQCSGYQPVLVWVTPNYKGYEPGRRRVLKSHLTWRGHRIYGSIAVDELISRCEPWNLEEGVREFSAGPFAVFTFGRSSVLSLRSPLLDMNNLLGGEPDKQLKDNAAYLFHHYSTYVAMNMMPFEDRRNPWQSFYPSMARCGQLRGHKSLLHAMLAQAAGSLAYMGCKKEEMSNMTLEHYALAVKELRKDLQEGLKDFSLVLAIVLTLIMAEVYNGISRAWRVHLNGAWEFFKLHHVDRPWQTSEIAWLTAQSLCLLRLRCDTMHTDIDKGLRMSEFGSVKGLTSLVASRPDFGFTVGATPDLLQCIIDTTQLAFQISQDGIGSYREASNTLYQRLQTCSATQDSRKEGQVQLHRRIFQLGAIIYFHRSIFGSLPRDLVMSINELLWHLKRYRELGGGHVTLWPVFMAAVEGYQADHQAAFRQWLDDNNKMGAASRRDIRSLIEAVWNKRARIGETTGVDEGHVTVDWSDVACEMGLDILLV